jgi:catechol 2,3-dioxygenase-like lactoylglutathione lyase family enzyme
MKRSFGYPEGVFMGVRKVNHSGISVSNMEKSLEFYCGVLGLELVMDFDVDRHAGLDEVVGMTDAVGRVVMLSAGDSLVELWCYSHPLGRALPSDYSPSDKGVTHIALEVDDVDEIHMRVVNAGFRAKSAPLDLGIHKTCYVHGPDDEIIELLEDRSDREMMARITRRTLAARGARGSSSSANNNSDQSELNREQVIK